MSFCIQGIRENLREFEDYHGGPTRRLGVFGLHYCIPSVDFLKDISYFRVGGVIVDLSVEILRV